MSGLIYGMPANQYHAADALGSTNIKALADPDISMLEVRQMLAHNEHKAVYDMGTLGHGLILEGSYDDLICRIDADSYRTKDAREERDAAYAAGLIPVNDSEVETMLEPLHKIQDAVMNHSIAGPLLTGHEPEVSAFWQEQGVNLKGRFDAYHADRGAIVDLKILSSARPSEVQKAISDFGYYIQAKTYRNGAHRLTGFMPDFIFVVAQKTEPYTVSVHRLRPEALEAAQRRIDFALARYRRAQESGTWPGYEQIYSQGLTPWERVKTEGIEAAA